MKKNTLKVLSLFAGAGGMDLGFKNAGYDIVWANDFDPDSVKTYKKIGFKEKPTKYISIVENDAMTMELKI